jgi:ATP-dependent DNA helicase RecQ
VLFYSFADAAKVRYRVDKMEYGTERTVAEQQLQHMIDWASGTRCRRRMLLAYFDEPFEGQPGRCCDVCQSDVPPQDWTIPAQKLLSCIKRTGERFGAGYVIEVLRGGSNERIHRLGHDRLSTYGIGRDQPETEWWYLTHQLLAHGHLRRAAEEYDAVKITERGEALLFRGDRLFLPPAPEPRRRRDASRRTSHTPNPLPEKDEPLEYDAELFDRLRALRKQLAEERAWPAYVIFHDRVLREMAARRPQSNAELRGIPGVGPTKAEAYGDLFRAEIARYEQDGHPAAPELLRPARDPLR